MTDNKLDQQADTNITPVEPQASEQTISAESQKDALGDKSLDAVSGGGWPYATTSSAQVSPTI
jgi:hypothetical protein